MSDPSSTAPTPNFTSSYSVVLPYPLDQVFTNLATASSVERVARLSSFVTAFSLGDTEPIAISSGALSSTRGGATLQLPSSSSPDSLPRTKFTMDETIPILGGIFKPRVAIEGSQTEDSEGRCCLYESVAQKNGITIWKLRSFEEVDDDVNGEKGTKVSERIEGWCPGWMRLFVERNCRHAHKAHMDMYHKLLDGSIA